MSTFKRVNGKFIVTVDGNSSIFDTIGESLNYIGGLRNEEVFSEPK